MIALSSVWKRDSVDKVYIIITTINTIMSGYDFEYVYDNVINKPFTFYRQQYHLLTKDHKETYLFNNIDNILDSYRINQDARYDDCSALTHAIKDSLDKLLGYWNDSSKYNLEE